MVEDSSNGLKNPAAQKTVDLYPLGSPRKAVKFTTIHFQSKAEALSSLPFKETTFKTILILSLCHL